MEQKLAEKDIYTFMVELYDKFSREKDKNGSEGSNSTKI